MVQKQEQKQEQNIYSPYYYPNFSRYNFPSDEDKYTEPKFSFPRWDDEVQPYTPPTPLLRRRASSPFSCSEDIDYFNTKLLSDNNNNTMLDSNTTMIPSDTSDSEEDESEEICDKIQSDIDLARKDQKTDYDQFKKAYATFHDDIRALQREIEAIEAICMKNVWDLKKGGAIINDDGTEIYYEPPCNNNNISSTNPTNNIKGGRLSSIPSAAAAARSLIGKKRSSPSILYKNKVNNQQEQQQNSFNDNNNNNNSNNRSRCLGIEDGGWLQDRVHQNEGIRC